MFGLRGVPGQDPSAEPPQNSHHVPFSLAAAEGLPRVWLAVAVVSVLGGLLTLSLMDSVSSRLMKAGLKGRDINKKRGTQPVVPESGGIVPGLVYVLCVVFLQPRFLLGILADADPDASALVAAQDSNLETYFGTALVAVLLGLFCGFLDDVLDLRWSQKILLSFVAVVPLVVAYAGPTHIVVPKPFRRNPLLFFFVTVGDGSAQELAAADMFGISLVDLGLLYLVYLLLFSVFCTNAININAGINGLEVGQSIIIAVAFLAHCVLQLVHNPTADPTTTVLPIALLAPFITTSLGLWWFNYYPSRVFVGDSYTYWAGMTLAVVGIVSHGSKTMMLFFASQLLNFLYSLPQILGVFGPCPRHRLPDYNSKTGKLEGRAENHNLINLVLRICGPLHERTLMWVVLLFQTFLVFCAFYIRYELASYFYEVPTAPASDK
jgi:UDP-N-acetylglucosamine--dolichyl-phosphate N-acetylglucosaminephosphotransferase